MNGSQCSLVFPTANKIIFTFVLGEKTYLIYLLLMSLLAKSSIYDLITTCPSLTSPTWKVFLIWYY